MAWRPTKHCIQGELDNTKPDRVTGWIDFAGAAGRVTLDLSGNFHRDIRGATIRFRGEARRDGAETYMKTFATHQTGNAGDITAGLPPHDYGDLPYIEWYSEENGRVVLEPQPDMVDVIGTPLSFSKTEPVSRDEQMANFTTWLFSLAATLHVPVVATTNEFPDARKTTRPR